MISSVPYPDKWQGSRLGPDPQDAPEDDHCGGCGLERDHEREDCDPRDVRDHIREMRWEERMREAGL